MKSAYIICVLLCITIGSLVLANGTMETTNKMQASRSQSSTIEFNDKFMTTAVPNDTSTQSTSTTSNSSTTISTTTITTTTTVTTAKPTSTTTTTTVLPSTPSTNTTTSSTTISTSTSAAKTTAIPAPPLPSKDRHFDGLSFFGGFILATCLMAIAVFSWKFYRQCNERNYRTL